MSVTPDVVEEIKNHLDNSTDTFVPIVADLTGGEVNVIAFQPNCRQNL